MVSKIPQCPLYLALCVHNTVNAAFTDGQTDGRTSCSWHKSDMHEACRAKRDVATLIYNNIGCVDIWTTIDQSVLGN